MSISGPIVAPVVASITGPVVRRAEDAGEPLPRIIYAATEDAAAAPHISRFTIKFNKPVNAANPVTGLTLSSGTYGITPSSNTATSFTYNIDSTWKGGDRPIISLDNASGNWTDADTGEALQDQSFPVENFYET